MKIFCKSDNDLGNGKDDYPAFCAIFADRIKVS